MRNKGFSLLELIIAIGVLAIGLVGVLQIFPVGLRTSYRSGMLTKAAFLAQNKIEELKVAGLEAVTASPPEIPLSGRDGDFEWKTTIEGINLEGLESTDDIKKVIVTISWQERNKTKSEEFITYITKL